MLEAWNSCLVVLQYAKWIVSLLCEASKDVLFINYRIVTSSGRFFWDACVVILALVSSVWCAFVDVICTTFRGCVVIFFVIADLLQLGFHSCALLCRILYHPVTWVINGCMYMVHGIFVVCQSLVSPISLSYVDKLKEILLILWQNVSSLVNSQAQNAAVAFKGYGYTTVDYIYNGVACISDAIVVLLGSLFISVTHLLQHYCTSFGYFVYKSIADLVLEFMGLIMDWHAVIITVVIFLVLMAFLISSYSTNWCSTARMVSFLRSSGVQAIPLGTNRPANEWVDVDVSDDEPGVFDVNNMNYVDDVDQDGNEFEDVNNDSSSVDADDDDEDEIEVSDMSVLSTDDSFSETDVEDVIEVQLPEHPSVAYSSTAKATSTAHQLERQLELERERSLCVVCQDQVKSVLILPCRHMCMCVDCARTIVDGTHGQRRCCPLCRTNIRTVMNVFT